MEIFGHIPLLHFVPRVNDDLSGVVFFQGHRHKSMTKRTCAAGNEDTGVIEHN